MKRNLHLILIIPIIFIVFTLLEAPCLGVTYYVDALRGNNSNPGTESRPWKTVAYALGTTSPVGSGDTVYLRAGTYREQVRVDKSGTENNWITVKNYPGESPIMDGSTAVTGWTQATENDPYLTVVIGENIYSHPNYSNIYWTRVEATRFPIWLDETVLYENRVHCRIASDPNQSEGYGEDPNEFRDVHEDCYGQDAYLYDEALTQEDSYWDKKTNYWDEPTVRVLVYNANNNVCRSKVDSYEKLTNYGKITFTVALGYNLSVGGTLKDCYRLINHPHVLDSAGEFYVSAIETIDGTDYRRVYLWPKDTANLTDNIRMADISHAFYNASYAGSYFAIEGIRVSGYSGHSFYFYAPTLHGGNNLIIKGCEIIGGGNFGIYCINYDRVRIENNYIRRCAGRGALVGNGDRCVIIGNDSRENGSTNLSFYTVTNSMMIGNKVGGERSAHANGTSCYGVGYMIENLLVANNVYYACNSAFQNVKNVILFANLYYVDDAHLASTINNWTRAHGMIGYEGYFVYLHNTVYDSRYASTGEIYHAVNAYSPHSDFAPQGAEEGPVATWYMYNNIYHGFANWRDEDWTNGTPRRRVYRGHNIYTWYQWDQRPSNGWSLNTGETECFIHNVSRYKNADYELGNIFVNPVYGAGDWTPKEGGPANRAGRDVQQLLYDLGIIEKFPEYDFTKDLAGNPWNSNPSIGCYEYTGAQDDEDGTDVQGETEVKCYNNVFNPARGERAVIEVSLKDRGRVRIVLYNTRGNKIIKLVDEEREAGTPKRYYWNGRYDSGNVVGSGLYFVHIQAGDYKKTKKIVVVK